MVELDGRPIELHELQTLALTNYGHFTSFRVDDGKVRGLSLHLERLERDCRILFDVSLDLSRVRDLIRRVAPKHGSTTVRVTVFDPATDLGNPIKADHPKILITRRSAAPLPMVPLTVQSLTFVREEPEVKSVGLYGSLRKRRIAQENGFDDALFLDEMGRITEGGTWNIGFFDGRRVVWPVARNLPGITMQLLVDDDHAHNPMLMGSVTTMKAAFATNAVIGVRAITKIDDIAFPHHSSAVDALRSKYLSIEPESI